MREMWLLYKVIKHAVGKYAKKEKPFYRNLLNAHEGEVKNADCSWFLVPFSQSFHG